MPTPKELSDQILRNLVNSAVRGAVYRVIWGSPVWVSVAIILGALAYVWLHQ